MKTFDDVISLSQNGSKRHEKINEKNTKTKKKLFETIGNDWKLLETIGSYFSLFYTFFSEQKIGTETRDENSGSKIGKTR